MFKNILFSIILILFSTALGATNYWQVADNEVLISGERWIEPNKYATFLLDESTLKEVLESAPMEFSDAYKEQLVLVKIPMPNGKFQTFKVFESPVMAEGLAARYPAIKTWAGKGVEDPTAIIRFDLTPKGFHGMILRAGSPVFIDPMTNENTGVYQVYYKKDCTPVNKNFVCEADGALYSELPEDLVSNAIATGNQLRNYRLAMATTVEYTNFHGGTVADGMAAVVTSVNRVVGVYRMEVAISLTLIDDNDDLIYTGPSADDPYTNNNGGAMLNQNQNNVNSVIGVGNYDIGHVFSTGGGGIAFPGGVCSSGNKARGVTGLGTPIGDPFDIDYVAHEMGHQFSALHTFNGNQGGCGGGNLSPNSAYEPGSGSTIMAYAGLCGAHNIQNNSNPYFHSRSFQQITTFSINNTGNNCAEIISIDNTEPTLELEEGNVFIPIGTPFELIAEGNDEEGNESLTYCWEQYDLGPNGHPNSPSGNAPLFRSFSPTINPVRTFPRLDVLLEDGVENSLGEVMPTYTRGMRFRCTVRDNNEEAGGVTYEQIDFDVTDQAGPFIVNTPGDITWIAGQTKGSNWEVGGTDQAPVNCAFVDIYLSLDGGNTWPILLEENVANDGSELFTVPAYNTDSARVKIKCSDNLFFALNPSMFSITTPVVGIETPSNETICSNDQLTIPVNIESENMINGVDITAISSDSDVEIVLSDEEISIPGTVNIIVNTNGAFSANNFDIIVTADVGFEVLEETVTVSLTNGVNPSNFDLFEPENETIDVGGTESFSWLPSDGANHYTFELATSPEFANSTIERVEDLTETFHISPTQLEAATVYYWRVIAYADCSLGAISEIRAFQTGGGNSSTATDPLFTGTGELDVSQGGSADINDILLSVQDNNDDDDIFYTIVIAPEAGTLYLNGEPLMVGDIFTQADVTNGGLSYEHNWSIEQDLDGFTFDISDGEGGWTPNQNLEFNIDLNVGIEELRTINSVKVFPNPTGENLVHFEMPMAQNLPVEITLQNTAGQIIGRWKELPNPNNQVSVFIENLSPGIYFYQVNSNSLMDSGKLVILK